MRELTRIARFAPGDESARILEDVACPGCGYLEPADRYPVAPGNRMRFFCDGCGAFVTIVLTEAQADALRRCSSMPAHPV